MKKKRYNKSTKKRSKKHKENKDPYFKKILKVIVAILTP